MKTPQLSALAVWFLVGVSQLVSAGVLFSGERKPGGILHPQFIRACKLNPPKSSMQLPESARTWACVSNLYTEKFFPAGITISPVSKELLEVITGIKDPRAELPLNNFAFVPNTAERRYQLNFDLPEKGSLSVRVLDGSLQELFKDKMCDFDRKYARSLFLPEKDTYYISVNYNDDWFVRKIIPD